MSNKETKSLQKNCYAEMLIKTLYSGVNSSTKNLLQFLYFSAVLCTDGGEIYKQFENICQDEFLCHKILAKNIVLLGGNPEYKMGKNICFSTVGIEYPKTIKQILFQALEIKENYIIALKMTLSKISNKKITQDLDYILQKNIQHRQIIKHFVEKTAEK